MLRAHLALGDLDDLGAVGDQNADGALYDLGVVGNQRSAAADLGTGDREVAEDICRGGERAARRDEDTNAAAASTDRIFARNSS